MSTEMVSFARPSYLANVEVDALTKALAGSGGGIKRISTEGGAFRLMDGKEEIATRDERWINVVVVNASITVNRQYYEGSYKKGAFALPVCYSVDGNKPADTAKAPQSSACATCPQNVKGSGDNNTRACRFSQRIAVTLEGDESNTVYQFAIPATAIFGDAKDGKMGFQAYARFLAAKRTPITAVVTEVRFDLSGGGVAQLRFKPVRALEEVEYYASVEAGKSDDAHRAITLDINYPADEEEAEEFEQAAPAPKAKPAPKTKSAPVVEDADDEADAEVEPVKVAPKPAPKTPPAESSIASIVSGWNKK